MKVTIMSPDLSNNGLGRAYVLAKLLERNYDVEIVGPKLNKEIWEPIKDEYDYQEVRSGPRMYQFLPSVPDILDLISGDVVYVSKPLTTSYGIGLLATLGRNRPLVLDIDDWETGFNYEHGTAGTYLREIPRLINANSYFYTRSFEALSSIADARTVSNRFLQHKFGGTVVPHAKDTDTIDPSRFDSDTLRDELDLPKDKFLVMFSGTPRPHKGVDDLARAVSSLNSDNIRAVVVGAHESEYVDKIQQIGGKSVIVRGMQPFDEIPKWVATADVIAIPQKVCPATRGQLPSKVFDAMAMAKPIIASDVNDLSKVLDGCGVLIEPENTLQLREAILNLYKNPQQRKELGGSARKRCIDRYSFDALAPVLNDVIVDIC